MTLEVQSDWTEERTSLLIQLRNAGMKRRGIAEEINKLTGANFTRSAICGKIDRLFTAAHPQKTPEEIAETHRLRNERRKLKRQELAVQRTREPFVPRIVEIMPRLIPFSELQSGECRFECAGQDLATADISQFLFCGNPTRAGSSFCWTHHAICWTPAGKSKTRAAA